MSLKGKAKGVVTGYVSLVGNAAKGAAGGEFFTAGRQLYRGARTGLMTRTCPRCYEVSLVGGQDGYQCERTDICGWEGDADSLKLAESQVPLVNPLVYVIAKGKQVEVERDYGRNAFFSWLFWLVSFCIFLYSFYWVLDGRWLFGVWCGLVCFWLSLHAIRMAYRAQCLRGVFSRTPRAFLRHPGLWFVT